MKCQGPEAWSMEARVGGGQSGVDRMTTKCVIRIGTLRVKGGTPPGLQRDMQVRTTEADVLGSRLH